MDELFMLLGLRLKCDALVMELAHETILIESNQVYTQQQMYYPSPGVPLHYNGNTGKYVAKCDVIWSYQTEFGTQYEKYTSSILYSNLNNQNMYLSQQGMQQQQAIQQSQQQWQNQMVRKQMNTVIQPPIGILPNGNWSSNTSSATSYPRAHSIWGSIKGIFSNE